MKKLEAISLITLGMTCILLAAIVVYSEVLFPWPSENWLNLFGYNLYLPLKRVDFNRFLAGTAALGAAVLILAFSVRHRFPKMERVAFVSLLTLVTLAGSAAVLQYTVIRDRYFDAGDTFAYFLGPKYFKELGYDKQYQCTVIAHLESGKWVPKTVRDLRNNRLILVSKITDKAGSESCRDRFTKERWEQFKADVNLYATWMPRSFYERVLADQGYNGTPVLQSFAGPIANLVPLNHRNMVLLSLTNLLAVFVMLGFVIHAFGWKTGLVFALVFWTDLLDRYLLGGACFRYLWISSFGISLSLMKRGKYLSSGMLMALSAGLIIFPVLFFAGIGCLILYNLIQKRGIDPKHLRFVIGASAAVSVLGVISISHGFGLSNWSEFFHQMSLNAGRFSIHRVGFIYNFLWPKDIFIGAPGVGYPVAAMMNPFWGFLSVNLIRWIFAALLIAAIVRTLPRLDDLGATVLLGFSLFFLLFGTVRYYYAGLVGLPLMWHLSADKKSGTLFLAYLLVVIAAAFLVEENLAYCFVYNTFFTAAFTVYLVAVIVFYEMERRGKTGTSEARLLTH